MSGLLIGALLATVVTVFWQPLLEEIRSGGPVEDQKQDVRSEAAETSRYFAVERTFQTPHGESWLVVLRHTTALAGPVAPVADEIRIYEETLNGLSLSFRFQPPQMPTSVQTRAESAVQADRQQFGVAFRYGSSELVFQLRAIRDLTGDGEPEVIGAYYEVAMAPHSPRPIVLYRPKGRRAYEVMALTRSLGFFGGGGPRMNRQGGPYAQERSISYGFEANLADKLLNPSIRGNTVSATPVEEYAVVGSDPALFLYAYVTKARAAVDPPRLLLRVTPLVTQHGRLFLGDLSGTPCRPLSHPTFQAASADAATFPRELRKHWYAEQDAAAPRRICPSHDSALRFPFNFNLSR